jgi:uncharacterized DUF497 family protein
VVKARVITIKSLIWDKNNREHIKKHNLTPRQAEQPLHDENKVLQEAHSGRLMVIGKGGRRMLSLILNAVGKKFYVVTARDADKKERAIYRKHVQNLTYENT